MKRIILLFLVVIVSLVLLVACNSTSTYDLILGTTLIIKTNGVNSKFIANNIYNKFDAYESLLSTSIEGSDVYRINHAQANVPIHVNDITIELSKISSEIYNLSNHAYNPAIYPLVRLWGFDSESFVVSNIDRVPPTDEQINEILYLIDYSENFVIDTENTTISKKYEGCMLDFGGIAKGYAIGSLDDIISSKKVLVNLGGNIMSYNKTFNIGLTNPRDGGSSLFGKFSLFDRESVSTSGDYQRFFTHNGKRYHHIIDPQTGKPSSSRIISASVVTKKIDNVSNSNYAAYGDALSTAIFILGKEKGIELMNNLGLSGVIIYENLTYEIIGNLDFKRMQ